MSKKQKSTLTVAQEFARHMRGHGLNGVKSMMSINEDEHGDVFEAQVTDFCTPVGVVAESRYFDRSKYERDLRQYTRGYFEGADDSFVVHFLGTNDIKIAREDNS